MRPTLRPCSACYVPSKIHPRSDMCEKCWLIWRAEEEKRLTALAVAVQHLHWFGIGRVRIATILGISQSTAAHFIAKSKYLPECRG